MATASLIKEDPHIADTVNKTESYRVLRGRVNGLGYSPDARLIPYLELAGFGSAALIRTFDLRYDLISALVECWRSETHTFHLPCGECTVTLEDVALQLGLPIDGSPVTGVSAIAEPAALCYSLLGASPGDDESNLSGLKFTWLKANFQHLRDNATEEELMCAARAYIMHIIGGVLMPDANNNRSWALYRMPFLASVSHQPYVYPLVNRWSIYPGIGRSYTVPIYRLLIEQHAGEGISYSNIRDIPEIVVVIPFSAYVHSQLWCTNAPIINFNVVEWYHGDRVLRQFGCIQYIPEPPKEVGKVHGINKRGKHGMHWGVVHQRYIAVWDNRMGRRPRMDMSSDLQPSPEYMQWYFSMGKPYLLGAQSL
ncbi:serine/threonine-protein phosphatase 7 long form homolog [Gossypium arboreum]|uniref:serine/threonine-protein phosphatase 7 long form homolog n=1 Tax=Gossypium arboreum TaxID=29729 RepID=UPI0022F1B18B|nr:serine/threonine-protein phosphatase 7 long form homolog [Gossypium arboreum]